MAGKSAGVHFSVSRALGVPLVTQIRDQIISAITAGDLRPGDRLPTVRQLAEFLGINRNTVAQAYRLLENDGRVITRAGGGTTVAGNPAAPASAAPDRLRALVREAFQQARAAGFSAREFAELAYHTSTEDDAGPAYRIVVIDDYRGELDFVCATIRRALPGSQIDAFLVRELQAADPVELRQRLSGADCALVAFYCLETVRPILASAVPVVAAGIGPTLTTLRRIAEECVGKQAAIVCTEPDGPDQMEAALRRAGITFTPGPLHAHVHDGRLAQILAGCEVIIASQGSADVVRVLAGGTPVIPYSQLVSEETLANLRSYTEYQAPRTPSTAD